jgi:cation diffusion facilitator family transporter
MEANLAKRLKFWRLTGAWLSLIVGAFAMALKFWAFRVSSSTGILSDALESVVNVSAGIFLIFAMRFALAPPDREHPYGHGKIEFITAIFEGGLVTFAAITILYEGVRAYFEPRALADLGQGIWILALAGLCNGALGLFLMKIGKSVHSMSLTADGKHVFSDFLTSIGLITALLLMSWTNWLWLDSAFAIGLGLLLLATGIPLMKEAMDALLDSQKTELLEKIRLSVEKNHVPAIIRLHHVRAMRHGHRIYVGGHVVVPEFWPVQKAHDLVEQFENSVVNEIFLEGEMEFHVDPCRRLFCELCEVSDCPIRKEPLKNRPPLTLEEMTSPVDRTDFVV